MWPLLDERLKALLYFKAATRPNLYEAERAVMDMLREHYETWPRDKPQRPYGVDVDVDDQGHLTLHPYVLDVVV